MISSMPDDFGLGKARPAGETAARRSILGGGERALTRKNDEYDKIIEAMINKAVDKAVYETAVNLSRTFATRDEVTALAKQQVPKCIRNLGASMPTGDVLRLGANGDAQWGEESAGSGGGGGDMDYSDWAFGFSISGAVVTVNSGKVRYGTRTPVTAAGKDITITADNTWIFVAYTYGGSAIITSSTSEPMDTEEVHNHVLYLVTLTSGAASVEEGNIKSLGDIFIPGSFG